MSHSLIWEVLKSNTALLVKRNGLTFSRERGNILNVNRKRFSGLANPQTIDIRPTRNAKTVCLNFVVNLHFFLLRYPWDSKRKDMDTKWGNCGTEQTLSIIKIHSKYII
jgi:hypothetical protein